MGGVWEPSLGAVHLGTGRCRFRVWAPRAERVEMAVCGSRQVDLERDGDGYFTTELAGISPGALYTYRLGNGRLGNGLDWGAPRPDPASRFQPQGVHGPSAVVARDFPWQGIPLAAHVLYELHVGTFTPEGTFDAVIPHLDRLRGLGVTALEIMPVAQFPGARNWGYDGVQPFAVQDSYGGPPGLDRLVDACHARGLAVVLDVVYNHLGPEGNYFHEYGPYFNERYRTPWGPALRLPPWRIAAC